MDQLAQIIQENSCTHQSAILNIRLGDLFAWNLQPSFREILWPSICYKFLLQLFSR